MDDAAILQELRRVADKLGKDTVSLVQFKKYGRISFGSVKKRFGRWNAALEEAGLTTRISRYAHEPGRGAESAEVRLLLEIIRLTEELGRRPNKNLMATKGRFTTVPYQSRWGSFEAACEAAYAKYGNPLWSKHQDRPFRPPVDAEPDSKPVREADPYTAPPRQGLPRRRFQVGELIDFRGLRFAPVNALGVAYLFGIVSRELGFLIEAIGTGYPSCEGKRRVDPEGQRWEHLLISLEYRSSDFRDQHRALEECDLVVCWIHDWKDCPIEVLELKIPLGYLPDR